TRTATEPYFACQPTGSARASCQSVVDPVPNHPARGPLRAGADRASVSPALQGSGVGGGFAPSDLLSAYGLPANGGAGQTVAIVDAYDDPSALADLEIYRSTYGLPPCTIANGCFRKVNQTGGATYPEANVEWSGEIALDLDMVSAICREC